MSVPRHVFAHTGGGQQNVKKNAAEVMGLERYQFVENLNDESLKLMLDAVNGARALLPANSKITRV